MGSLDRSKAIWVGVVALIIGLCGIVYYVAQPKGSDSDQIQGVLKSASAASRSGKAGSVLDLLSKSFQVNGSSPQRIDVADAIRRYKPDCTVDSSSLAVSGDDATMEARLRIQGNFLGASIDSTLDRVQLTFHREPASAFGFIPIRAWRLQQVQFDGPLPDNSPVSGWIRGVGDL